MLPIIPDYSAPSVANIVNGLTANATDVANLTTSTNGVNARLDDLTNNVKTEISATDTLTQNEDVQVFCDASGGAFTVTLPARAGQVKPIYIKVTDTSYNGITIACAGADVIEEPNNPLATPTATSITLKSPNQDLVLVPTSNAWRLAHIAKPEVAFQAHLTTAGVTIGNTSAKLYCNNEDYDYGGYYNNATSGPGGRFTPLIAERYSFAGSVYFQSGTSSEVIAQIRINGTPITQLSSPGVTGNEVIATTKSVYLNGTTDYAELWIRSATATKGILALSYVTWFQGEFVAFR
jgi:hypothetical protein